MSDQAVLVLAVAAGVVVIAALILILYRGRLGRIDVDVRRGRVKADMHDKPSSGGGVVQRGIKAGGNVTAHDATGRGAQQENIKAAGNVEASAGPPAKGGAAKKR